MNKLGVLFIFIMVVFTVSSQEFRCQIKINNTIENSVTAINEEFLKDDFSFKYNIKNVRQSNPDAKTPEFQLYYFIEGNGNKEEAITIVQSMEFIDTVELLERVHHLSCKSSSYTSDEISNYAYDLIEVGCAWNYTKSNPTINIGIVEAGIDKSHIDYDGKLDYITGIPEITDLNGHGTQVAGFAGATTNNGIGVKSVGYNNHFRASIISPVNIEDDGEILAWSDDIWDAVWSLHLLNGAGLEEWGYTFTPIINLSWAGGLFPAVQEIIDNGTVVVCGAGNKPDDYNHPTSVYDGVISVSSVNKDNKHGPTGHAHNDLVDICAPGVNLQTTYQDNSYGGAWGTSFASPIVCGVIALMLDVNPCLTPADIEKILKLTADPIDDEDEFQDELGAGRINAHKAVIEAYKLYGTFIQNKTYIEQANEVSYQLKIGEKVTNSLPFGGVYINSSNNIFKANKKIILDNGIEIKGSTEFFIDDGIKMEDC